MNQRMREPFHTLIWKASIGYNDSWSQVDPEVLEKFADLIVQDCVECCEQNVAGAVGTYAAAHNSAISKCVAAIKRHFGFEE